MNRKVIYLLIVIICFSFSVLNVDAATKKTGVYKGEWNSSGATYANKKFYDGTVAYCMNHSRNLKSGANATYYRDTNWDSSTSCTYSGNYVDCSMMTGFVMAAALSETGYTSVNSVSNNAYVFIQKAEQTYIKNYASSWDAGTNKSYLSTAYKTGGKTIKQIIKQAYSNYTSYLNGLSVSNPGLSISLSVNGNDTGLYYNPSKGKYYSYKINVTSSVNSGNSENIKITLITNQTDNVRICTSSDAKWSDCTESLEISSSSSGDVYLISKSSSLTSIKLTATASYYVNGGSSTGYDTVRWCYSSNSSKYQCLLTFTSSNSSISGENFTKSKTMTFSVVPVKTSDCNDLYSGWDSTIDSGSGTSYSDSDSLVCQYNASGSPTTENTDDYTANFKTCVMKNNSYTIDYWYKNSSGTCKSGTGTTSIAVGEQGVFTFGGVEGDTHPVVKGQGFYLVSNNTFVVNLSWKKALIYASNNNTYFYLSNSGSVHHDTTVYATKSDCQSSTNGKKFDTYANSYMNKLSLGNDNSLSDIYSTYVNSTTEESVPAVVEVDGDSSTEIASGESLTVTYKFSTPVAYTKIIDNTITYDDSVASNSSYKNMGNRYYTMVKYSGSSSYDSYTYPFNLNISNLSVVDGITWAVTGSCDVDLSCDPDVDSSCDCDPEKETCGVLYQCDEGVDTCSLNYDYRSISVSDPFPKATSVDDVALNWQDAYDDSETMSRIASTFNNSIVYSVTLTGDSATSLANKYTSSYELFDDISVNGKSDFVTSEMNTINNSNSYCGIGVWNSSCDSWR